MASGGNTVDCQTHLKKNPKNPSAAAALAQIPPPNINSRKPDKFFILKRSHKKH